MPMKHPVLKALCLGVYAAALVACNKEVIDEPRMRGPVDESTGNNPDNNTNNPLAGTYRVVASTANGRGETRFDMMGTPTLIVTNTQVTCDNFNGTVVIDGKNITAKDISMGIQLAYTNMTYLNGMESGDPVSGTKYVEAPAQSSSAPYTLKGSDSISCKVLLPAGVGEALGEAGAKLPDEKMQHYAFAGDTLILTGKWIVSQTLSNNGIPVNVFSTDLSVMKLVRVSK